MEGLIYIYIRSMECFDVDNKQYSKVISLLLPEVYLYMFWKVILRIYYYYFIQNKIRSTYCNTIQMLNIPGLKAGGNMRQSNY